jgi:hypothetical protein
VFYVSWAIALIYMIGLGLAIPFGAFALAISPTKGRTLKRMALVFITVSISIVVLGILAAGTLQSHLVARATGLLCVPVGLMSGTIVGWSHARSQRKREPRFPSLSIRG